MSNADLTLWPVGQTPCGATRARDTVIVENNFKQTSGGSEIGARKRRREKWRSS